jgi:hypothetical protein
VLGRPLANKFFAGFAQQMQANLDELLRELDHAAKGRT